MNQIKIKSKKLLLLLIILQTMVSCKEKSSNLFDLFDETINIPKAETLHFLDSIIMQPSFLLPFDSLMVLKDKYDGQYISLVNIKSKKIIKRFLNMGQGPKEIVQFGAMYKSWKDREFIVMNIAKSELLFFNLDSILNDNCNFYKKIKLTKEQGKLIFMTIGFIAPDRLIGTGINLSGRYMLADTSGKVVFSGLEYPYADKNIDLLITSLGYQASLVANFAKNQFATTTLHGEILEIGKYQNNKLKITKRLGNRINKYHKNGKFVLEHNSKAGCCNLTANDKNIYILYSGRLYTKYKHSARYCNTILSVDWEGKPVAIYKTKEYMVEFALDNSGKYLYGITNNPNAQIVRYKLDNFKHNAPLN